MSRRKRLEPWFAYDPEVRYRAEIKALREDQRVRNEDLAPEWAEYRKAQESFAELLAIELMKLTIDDLRLKVDARELEILSLRRLARLSGEPDNTTRKSRRGRG